MVELAAHLFKQVVETHRSLPSPSRHSKTNGFNSQNNLPLLSTFSFRIEALTISQNLHLSTLGLFSLFFVYFEIK
jgi:hypothetical protein